MNDIMKIVQALEDSNILLKGVTKTIKNETDQKGGFLSILLGTLLEAKGASLLENLLTGKGFVRAGEGPINAGYVSSIFYKSSNSTTSLNKF